MLARSHRFHGRHSLKFVMGRGAVLRCNNFSIKYIHNSRSTDFRSAVVVSKKVSKAAVVRNRIRRRMYEAIRTYEPAGSWDIVVLVYTEQFAIMEGRELQQMIHDCLRTKARIPSRKARQNSKS